MLLENSANTKTNDGPYWHQSMLKGIFEERRPRAMRRPTTIALTQPSIQTQNHINHKQTRNKPGANLKDLYFLSGRDKGKEGVVWGEAGAELVEIMVCRQTGTPLKSAYALF